MNEIERMVRTIFLVYGETKKIPIAEEDLWCYDYEESYIIQKCMRHKELIERIIERGYKVEQAEEIILECCIRGVMDLVSLDLESPVNRDNDEYVMVNEEHWVESEVERLGYRVFEEFMKAEVREYVAEYPFFEDEDEVKLREVYAERNLKELSKDELVRGLVGKGFTEREAEGLIEKYTTIEISEDEKKNWSIAEKLFMRPEYKPLKYHEKKGDVKRILKGNREDFVKEITDCYEIMQIEEWLLKEYEELSLLRRYGESIFGTEKVPFRSIRKILWESEKRGRMLTHSELKQRIVEECKVTDRDAEIAIYGAFRTFKIRKENSPRETRNQKPVRERGYYWSGTSCKYPPLTLQDKILNPIKNVFREAQEQGKEALTFEELTERAFKAYKKYKEERRGITYTKTISREYVEMMIKEAEELLLITPEEEQSGKTIYRLNHQILKIKI